MLSPDSCAVVILAGGQSRRMGRCKALLPLGSETMLAHITKQLEQFPERWLSANDRALGDGFPGRTVPDIYPGCGPMAGLQAVFRETKKDWLFCVTCDMPRFTGELASAMLEAFPPQADAMVCVDGAGQTHPLCGIYARTALPALERHLQAGDLCVMALLEELRTVRFEAAGRFLDALFLNINTPQAYDALLEKGDRYD